MGAAIMIPEYSPLSSDQTCIDPQDSHAHHSSFATGIQRRDGELEHGTLLSGDHSLRFPGRQSSAYDVRYDNGSRISDSGSTSISTSPSSSASNVSPLNLGNVSAGYAPSSQHFSGGSLVYNAPYNAATSTLNRHSSLNLLSDSVPFSQSSYGTSNGNTMIGQSYPTAHPSSEVTAHQTPPFVEQRQHVNMICEDRMVVPKLEGKIEKGFFLACNDWTCYRRNYFAVQCSYTLDPHIPSGSYYIQRHGQQPRRIQAFALNLKATMDGHEGKAIELIQHTPKRDSGPKYEVEHHRVLPSPHNTGRFTNEHLFTTSQHPYPSAVSSQPNLPYQHDHPSEQPAAGHQPPHSNYSHTYERIQFKTATANNGKRRAAQQYYFLILELMADVRADHASQPEWVRVAERSSAQLVVRGRSPSHYQNEGSGSNSRGGVGGAPGGGPAAPGGVRPSRLGGSSFGRGAPSAYSSSPYRHSQYSSSHSNTLGTAMDLSSGAMCVVKDEPAKSLAQPTVGYRYFPHPLYQAGLLPNPAKSELNDHKGAKDELGDANSCFSASWQNGCRFTGAESSRGYYPNNILETG